jgi:hypothetical protein
MAYTWPPKAPGAIRAYDWTPKADTPLDSVSIAVTSGTVTATSDVYGDTATITVTGGADGVEQTLTLTATAGDETFVETVYISIEASTNRLANTVRDVCLFALRKVSGIAEEPEADELADAIERLNDMVAGYRVTGADMGLSLPLVEADVLKVPDHAYRALKLNLRNELHEFYGEPLTQTMVMDARNALAVVKNANLTHRAPEYF